MSNQSQIITAAVTKAAVGAVIDTAAKNTNNIPSKSVDDATPELSKAISKAVTASPEMQYVTNAEPFWKKRSFYAQVGSGLAALMVIANPILDYLQKHTTDTGSTTITVLGLGFAAWAGYSAYGAGHSTKPLFTPDKPPANPVAYRG